MEPELQEGREAQLRENAIQLAREVSEANFRNSEIPQVKRKMMQLMDFIIELEGKDVERQIGEDQIVHFHAFDKTDGSYSDSTHDDRRTCCVLKYTTKDKDGHEQLKASSFVDCDGGSRLMESGVPSGQDPAWAVDDAYTEDLKSLDSGYYNGPNLPILINRFRELRLAARMAQLVLGGKEQKVNLAQAGEKEVADMAESIRKDASDIAEK